MTRIAMLTDQIRAARAYTESLLDADDPADWFRMPTEGVSHVAWQVGHLAFAGYRLALERVRGPRPDDVQLISDAFLAQFGRGSSPDPDPSSYPDAAEIRATFDRVQARVITELAVLDDAELDRPVAVPHRLCGTKAEILAWAARHEMFHAGQIALLRRLLGRPPLW